MDNHLFEADEAAALSLAAPSDAARLDQPLDEVHEWFMGQRDLEKRFGKVLRQSIDEVLDGQRTGRCNIDDLEKTERTYLGTKVEIVTRSEFALERGAQMDYSICNHDVDAKFTSRDSWTIPREANKHICLLIKANDHKSTFQVGLIRIQEHLLNLGRNRDGKRSLSTLGRKEIRWIIPTGELPENFLMSLSPADREAIFHASDGRRGNGNGGQLRTNELFRRAQKRLIERNTILTVASQDDSTKRVRDARIHLRPDGIIILGHQDEHPRIARDLGLPVPSKGSWIAVRVAHITNAREIRPTTHLAGKDYAIWQDGDDPIAAPPTHK